MNNIAKLLIRLGQIQAEFGDTAASRAAHAASVAVAKSVLARAEPNPREGKPVATAEIIPFPKLSGTPARPRR